MTTRTAVALTVVIVIATTLAAAAGEDPLTARIDIVDTLIPGQRMPIALPEIQIDTAQASDPLVRRAGEEVRTVLWDDLHNSGVFQMIPEELYSRVGATTPEKVPYDDWVAIGTNFLTLLEIGTESGQLVVRGRVFETRLDRKMIVGKRYDAPYEAARRVAHTFADLVIETIGGTPGVCRSKLVFVSDRDGGRGRELYVSDYDGHDPRRLTATRNLNMAPDWSPDDATIVYSSSIRGNWDLYLMPRLGGENTVLFAKDGLNASPSWAADGSRIAFASSFAGGDSEIYSIRPDGSGLVRLTHNKGIDTNPAFSPSGRQIAFTSDRTGHPQVHLMDADGLNTRRLTKQGYFNDGAAWAPAGRDTRLAYSGMTSGRFQIFVYTVETDALVQLTDAGSNEAPAWSPDGRQIAFTSKRGGRSDIWIMNDDGTNLRRVTRGGNNFSPAWSH